MFHNAYALFFLAVLIGSAFALWAIICAHAHEVSSVLRGKLCLDEAPPRSRFVRFRSGRRPAFPPVRFNTCRLRRTGLAVSGRVQAALS